MDLTKKRCVPCEGGMPPLAPEKISELLPEVPEWSLVDGEEKKITREFEFKDFAEAINFVDSVARIAEQEGHHPNIDLHDWNKVKIELSTHAIKGLSENDFIVAAKINSILS